MYVDNVKGQIPDDFFHSKFMLVAYLRAIVARFNIWGRDTYVNFMTHRRNDVEAMGRDKLIFVEKYFHRTSDPLRVPDFVASLI
jgi:hypothetical protein